MKQAAVLLCLVACVLFLPACALAPLHGQITPAGYLSPLNNFVMKQPAFAGLQMDDAASEQGGRVEFSDAFGNAWAVGYVRTGSVKSGITLADLVGQYAMTTWYRPRSPQASVVRGEAIEVRDHEAYFAVVSMPSPVDEKTSGTGTVRDSVRALLALEVNGFYYVLEQEMNTDLTPTKADTVTEWQLHSMQESLNHMGEGMRFK